MKIFNYSNNILYRPRAKPEYFQGKSISLAFHHIRLSINKYFISYCDGINYKEAQSELQDDIAIFANFDYNDYSDLTLRDDYEIWLLYGYGILKRHDLIKIISLRLSYEPLKNGKNTYCNYKKYLISKSQNSMFKFDKNWYSPDKTFYYPSASFLLQMNESNVAAQALISKIEKKFDGYVERSKALENGYVNFKKLNHGYLYPYPETAILSMMNVDLIKPCVWLPYIRLH